MQKLAVALTTQEEFNEYMEWRASKKWSIYPNTHPWYRWILDNLGKPDSVCIWHDSEWRRWFVNRHKEQWYKIISLKEAIGEKENKEIIREGEAKRYIHPKTQQMITLDKELWDWYVVGLNMRKMSDLEDYWFEPIEESKRDWISNMKDNLRSESKVICADFGSQIIEAVPFEYIREAIEKHMPKQQKITINELEDICSGIWHTGTLIYRITELLKSKWLL